MVDVDDKDYFEILEIERRDPEWAHSRYNIKVKRIGTRRINGQYPLLLFVIIETLVITPILCAVLISIYHPGDSFLYNQYTFRGIISGVFVSGMISFGSITFLYNWAIEDRSDAIKKDLAPLLKLRQNRQLIEKLKNKKKFYNNPIYSSPSFWEMRTGFAFGCMQFIYVMFFVFSYFGCTGEGELISFEVIQTYTYEWGIGISIGIIALLLGLLFAVIYYDREVNYRYELFFIVGMVRCKIYLNDYKGAKESLDILKDKKTDDFEELYLSLFSYIDNDEIKALKHLEDFYEKIPSNLMFHYINCNPIIILENVNMTEQMIKDNKLTRSVPQKKNGVNIQVPIIELTVTQEMQNIINESSSKLSDYQIIKEKGQGGFSVVYQGRRKSDGTEVAIRTPIGALKGDTIDVKMFKNYLKEIQIWASLSKEEDLRSGVIQIFDWGMKPFPWMVMELMEGDLNQKISKLSYKDKLSLNSVDVKPGRSE